MDLKDAAEVGKEANKALETFADKPTFFHTWMGYILAAALALMGYTLWKTERGDRLKAQEDLIRAQAVNSFRDSVSIRLSLENLQDGRERKLIIDSLIESRAERNYYMEQYLILLKKQK